MAGTTTYDLVDRVIVEARRHLGLGVMDSSARVCLADALACRERGDLEAAYIRGMKSLAYSVGIGSLVYRRLSR